MVQIYFLQILLSWKFEPSNKRINSEGHSAAITLTMPPPHPPPVTSVDQNLLEVFSKLDLIYFYFNLLLLTQYYISWPFGRGSGWKQLCCSLATHLFSFPCSVKSIYFYRSCHFLNQSIFLFYQMIKVFFAFISF